MNSSIIPFNFKDHSIRVINDKNNEPLFVAKDVAFALGYKDTVNAIKLHCKRTKSLKDIGVADHHPLDPQTKVISESDLYHLTMKSQLESAEAFQDWVCEEVLPSIRKTGAYSAPTVKDKEVKPAVISSTAKAMLSMAKAFGFKDNQAIISADKATNKLIGVSPLALLGADLISETKDVLLNASDIGKQVGLSGKKINMILEEKGFHESYRDAKNNKLWKLTDDGEKFAEALDTNKKHGDGTPIKQIKWYSKVVEIIKGEAA